MPRVRQNLRNKINKLHCFRPLSRDNGGVDKIQPCGVLPAVTVIHLTSDDQNLSDLALYIVLLLATVFPKKL